MNLDDTAVIADLLAQIERMPAAFQSGWEAGKTAPLPALSSVERMVLAGMGDAGVAASLLAAYAHDSSPVPLVTHQDYALPGWARGPNCLAVLLSGDADGEEARSWLDSLPAAGCPALLIAPPGALSHQAAAAGIPWWALDRENVPAGCFGRLLALAERLRLIPDPARELEDALAALRAQQPRLLSEVPVARNPAKREAGQLVGRLVLFYASDFLTPVARHWANQINRLANAWAHAVALPEANHNALEGILNPEDALERLLVLFLRAQGCQPRNRARADLTRRGYMVAGLNTDSFNATGETRLAQMLTALQFGDYLAAYLAAATQADPSARQISASFARALADWRDTR